MQEASIYTGDFIHQQVSIFHNLFNNIRMSLCDSKDIV
jgi:hypothetical protein